MVTATASPSVEEVQRSGQAAAEEVEVAAESLYRILHNAALFAANPKDKGYRRPTIEAVKLEAKDKELLAVGTDSFVLGWDTCGLTHDVVAETLISVEDVKRFCALLKPLPRLLPVKLAIGPFDVRLETAAGALLTQAVDGDYPNWRNLVAGTEGGDIGSIALAAKYLTRLGKVLVDGKPASGQSQPIRFEFGKDNQKATRISIGFTFKALLMPVRERR